MSEKTSPKDLAFQGGRIAATALETFLNRWEWANLDMPWRIWEWVSDIAFEHEVGAPALANAAARRPQWLERLRLFGRSGDLELRRDGEHFLWRFVGLPTVNVPAGFGNADYWQAYPERSLTLVSRRALLWGKEIQDDAGLPQGQWQEDRVGYAQLIYPEMQGDERVVLEYREYLYGDNLEAVWWLGLERWEGQNG